MLELKYLRDAKSLTRNDTFKVDLPNAGLLSGLYLHFSGGQQSGHGQSGGKWRLLDYLTQLRVVGDGSEIIASYSPKIAHALAFFDQGDTPPTVWRNYASETQFEEVSMCFGRKLGDRELGLDLSKFNSVELEITNDATSTEFQDTLAVSIAMVLHHPAINPPTFQGHLRKESWREWTTVQDAWEYLEIPTSHKLRRILLRCLPDKTTGLDDTIFHNQADDIKLAVQTGAMEVLRVGLDDLARLNAIQYGLVLQSIQGQYWSADAAHEIGVGYWTGMGAVAGARDGAAAATNVTVNQGDTGGTPRFETYEGDSPVPMIVRGYAPHYCAVVYQSDPDDPMMYLDPAALATVQLDIHTRNAAAAAAGTNEVVLERLVN